MSRANPSRQVILSAAGVAEEDLPVAADFDASLPPDLEFDPVPRLVKRSNGLTPERQRIFVKMLSMCGSVKTACRVVHCSSHAIYNLRNSPGAESFAAAWDKAVERGARRILDVLIDQAINGTPEYFYKDGQIVGERRHFNTRAMMWIVAHNFPEKYGVTGGLMHSASGPIGLKRMRDRWRQEWNREQMEDQQTRHQGAIESIETKINAIRSAFKQNLATDPAKRAAWELLTGPTDWSDFEKVPSYGWNLPDANQNRPDMIVANAMGMDAMWGMSGGEKDQGEAPDGEEEE